MRPSVIPSYTRTMKTAISLPDELFARIEAAAADTGMSRSAFLAAAAESYLRQRDADAVTARINEVIERVGDVSEPWALDAGLQWLEDESW